MNAEPAEHRHLMFCNLDKGRDKKYHILQTVTTAIYVDCPRFSPLPPISCRTKYSISGGSLCSRNNASRRYNVAIEAQKQKECHPMNLSV